MPSDIMNALAGMGDAGLIVLAAAFVFGALAFVPRNLMCVLGGTVFGHAAFPVALVSATLGACAALLIARYLFRRPFQRMADRRPAWKAVAAAVDGEGWRIALLLRIASPLPGSVVNYMFGLTRIPLWRFAPRRASDCCRRRCSSCTSARRDRRFSPRRRDRLRTSRSPPPGSCAPARSWPSSSAAPAPP